MGLEDLLHSIIQLIGHNPSTLTLGEMHLWLLKIEPTPRDRPNLLQGVLVMEGLEIFITLMRQFVSASHI